MSALTQMPDVLNWSTLQPTRRKSANTKYPPTSNRTRKNIRRTRTHTYYQENPVQSLMFFPRTTAERNSLSEEFKTASSLEVLQSLLQYTHFCLFSSLSLSPPSPPPRPPSYARSKCCRIFNSVKLAV